MTYPNFRNKHLEDALINPEDFIHYKEFDKKKFPSKYVITYQSSALRGFRRKYAGKYELLKIYPGFYVHHIKNSDIGFIKMTGIGSPHAVVIFEELISLGAREFINIGTAGGLQHEGVFLCDRAIRDEGASSHYMAHEKYSYPDKGLTEKLARALEESGIVYEKATTWTIDTPYRETKAEINQYKKEGVATVEMEASALFAVAKLRKVKIAAAFVVSDVLGEKWEPKFHHVNVKSMQNKMIDAAMTCLKKK